MRVPLLCSVTLIVTIGAAGLGKAARNAFVLPPNRDTQAMLPRDAAVTLDAAEGQGLVTGPDGVTGEVGYIWQLGREGPIGSGTVGLGVSTTLCNKGDVPIPIDAFPGTNHPVIVANAYRLQTVDGSHRFEQIGLAWLKHVFASSNADSCGFGCQGGLGDVVGPGCSDTYGAAQFEPCGFYGNGIMGPRSAVHPYTGQMPGGGDLGSGGGCEVNYSAANHIGHNHDPDPPGGSSAGISHRLQIPDVDLMPAQNPGARYFCEGQYVAPGEYRLANGSQNNNVAYHELDVTGPDEEGMFFFEDVGNTFSESPAVDAWLGAGQSVIEPAPLADGLGRLACEVTDLGGGTWHYEYALYNMNMGQAMGVFSVPAPPGVTITNVGFHAPLNHAPEANADNYSNDPWTTSVAGDAVTWTTDTFDQDPLANAVRYATLYNFRFDADVGPRSVYATIGFFKTGGQGTVATLGPRPPGPQDCNGNGIPDDCDLDCGLPGCSVTGCGESSDCDGTGVPDECEIDCNENGVDDRCDIASTTSADCTGNGIPDECEADCDENGAADSCDMLVGAAEDCNANGVLDSCELSAETDANGNGVLDECELACVIASTAEEALESTSIGDIVIPKVRTLSFRAGDAGRVQAVRVTFVSLPIPYDGLNGRTMWVGAPQAVCEHSAQGTDVEPADCILLPEAPSATYWAANLQCTPFYTNWQGTCTGGACLGGINLGAGCSTDADCKAVVHVSGSGIVPSGAYDVQIVDEGCSASHEGNYSVPLTLNTSRWGDLVSDCFVDYCGPPNDITDFIDIMAVVDKFKNLPGAPSKARADLAPGTTNRIIDFIDIGVIVEAFRNFPYTFPGPGECP